MQQYDRDYDVGDYVRARKPTHQITKRWRVLAIAEAGVWLGLPHLPNESAWLCKYEDVLELA